MTLSYRTPQGLLAVPFQHPVASSTHGVRQTRCTCSGQDGPVPSTRRVSNPSLKPTAYHRRGSYPPLPRWRSSRARTPSLLLPLAGESRSSAVRDGSGSLGDNANGWPDAAVLHRPCLPSLDQGVAAPWHHRQRLSPWRRLDRAKNAGVYGRDMTTLWWARLQGE